MNITQFGICQVSIAPIRANADDASEIVTQLLFGDYIEIIEQGQPWIKIYFPQDDYEGFMDFKQVMFISEEEYKLDSVKQHQIVNNGVLSINGPLGKQQIIAGSNLPNHNKSEFSFGGQKFQINEPLIDLTDNFVDTALRYENTPYLWGGKGIFGIDCSGLIQIVAKIHGISLPRNASQQVNIGKTIQFSECQKGDIMYFINSKDIIHHVGIVIDNKRILHAAGHVRIDAFDEKGIFRTDLNTYTHFFHSIKRL